MHPHPVFFMHIPKTAGTSLRAYLVDQYPNELIFQKNGWSNFAMEDLNGLGAKHLIMGHYDYRLCPFVTPGSKIVTFLREPIGRTISAIRHALRDPAFCPTGLEIHNRCLSDIIVDPASMRFFANTQTAYLSNNKSNAAITDDIAVAVSSGQSVSSDDLSPDLDSAVAMLKELDFVGLVENFDKDIIALADLCGFFPPKYLPALNIGTQGKETCDSLTTEHYSIVKEYNKMDLELYAEAVKINNSYPRRNRFDILREKQSHYQRFGKEQEVSLANPFSGSGFHELESNERNEYFRWSGPSRQSEIALILQPGHSYLFEALLWFPGSPFASSAEVYVDGHKIPFRVERRAGICEHIFEYRANESINGLTEVEFLADNVSASKNDLRMRGFVLSKLTVILLSR